MIEVTLFMFGITDCIFNGDLIDYMSLIDVFNIDRYNNINSRSLDLFYHSITIIILIILDLNNWN